jgi:uncharacterized Ntn-hydrolase superfamily protein
MTYSIVARDAETGEMGVAVQTGIMGVGTLCPWAEAGIGVVATQASVRVSHGPSGLALMRNGHTAKEALEAVLNGDEEHHIRQVGMIDANGVAAAFTGDGCIVYAGHWVGDGYAVQANMMARDGVPTAMAKAFEGSQGTLVVRLLAALRAAQAAGGDFRGQQSAALKIVQGALPKNHWEGVLYDVRVDDHPAAVEELARICTRYSTRTVIREGYQLADAGNFEGALAKLEEAAHLDPDEHQFRFLFAVELATTYRRIDLVSDVLRHYFQEERWRDYFRRRADARMRADDETRTLVEALMA